MSQAVGLRAWIAIGHPRYRRLLGELLVLALLLAGLVYLENTLLTGLVRDLAGGTALPWGWLAGLFGAGLLRAWADARSRYVGNDLSMRSRDDLEAEVFYHLLHRDDDFYRQHASGEILNRLEVDLYRVLQRRETVAQVVASSLVVGAHLIFFARCDLRLALVVVSVCLLGTLVSERASRPVRVADKAFWGQHDRVKVTFDDCLKALVEIQVGGLFGPVLRRLGLPQASRRTAFRQWARADQRVALSRGGWPVLAFLLAVLVVLTLIGGDAVGGATPRGGAGTVATRLALIPVLVYALPGVFSHVTYLATLRLDFQLARNSIDRLLEYESDEAAARPRLSVAAAEAPESPPPPAVPVRFEQVTYRYAAPDGELQGGVDEVTASFPVGRWSCLVGAAGAGKSTLVNLALGRAKPQRGRVLLGDVEPGRGGAGELATVATIMPQTVVLLDATIRANLALGSDGVARGPLPDADLDLLEDVGLAAVCRLKALDLRPGEGALEGGPGLRELREQARGAVSALGVRLLPFEEEPVDLGKPFYEGVLGGRSDEERVVPLLVGDRARSLLRRLTRWGLGDELPAVGRVVLAQSRSLLGLADYHDFAQLAPATLTPLEWELRRAGVDAAAKRHPLARDRALLVAVGLTARPREWGASPEEARSLAERLRASSPRAVEALRQALEGRWAPFDGAAIHRYLSWRDNLLFASVIVANQRQRRRVDEALLGVMAEAPWRRLFVGEGLRFEVGRHGSRLSGGQAQLVALARAALRRTPFLILDEPTSALDPASRDRVAAFLRAWCRERVVLTISHDPGFVRQCDEIHVLQGGRLIDHGSFEALSERSPAFRSVFRLEGGSA